MKIAPIGVTLIDHMGTDLSVVNAARVSFHKESGWENWVDEYQEDELRDVTYVNPYFVGELSQSDVKLINYLAKHKHFSPFNHCFLSFRIKAPIFVARQLVKHKFMPWNEVSRRYVDSEPEFYVPLEWRAKADNVKQGSGGIIGKTMDVFNFVESETHRCLINYQELLAQGVCPEQARMVLPQNTMTEWIWSGTLGAFADMLKLRLDPHTQQESRDVAKLIYEEVEKLFPVSIKALLENK